MDALACQWDAAKLLVFSGNVFDPLIYYSHLGPLIISVLLGSIVLFNNPRALVNRALFAINLFFSIWIFFDLVLWASERPEYIMFFWSAIVPIELLIYAASWYLVAIFANNGKEPSLQEKLAAAATFIPIFLFAHTSFNLLGFDLSNCDREAIEGPVVQYLFLMQILFIAWVIMLGVKGYRRITVPQERKQFLFVTLGVILFLSAFVAGNIIVTYFLDLDWSYEQYKLLGMPIFVAFITYSAIKFKAFNVKIITAQALVMGVAVLVFSMLFLNTIVNVRIIALCTFVLVVALGYFLIKNVRKEIQQHELIQKQEEELEAVNKQQENLLHFISHEIKGYLTKSEAAFASITEGDYGGIPDALKGMATSALADVRKGVRTVMEILDASNLKKGTMGYTMKTFDLNKAVVDVVNHLKPAAEEKNVVIEVTIAKEGNYMLNGDEEKIRQHLLRNLIDNAIRYTPSGTIRVELTQQGNMVRFSVEDNGVGITPEDMARLFTEGGHGKDSIKVNVHSTGYGLFIAKQIVEAHKGKIWAESGGAGKGARFIVELPVA